MLKLDTQHAISLRCAAQVDQVEVGTPAPFGVELTCTRGYPESGGTRRPQHNARSCQMSSTTTSRLGRGSLDGRVSTASNIVNLPVLPLARVLLLIGCAATAWHPVRCVYRPGLCSLSSLSY